MSKPSYASYFNDKLSGFGGDSEGSLPVSAAAPAGVFDNTSARSDYRAVRTA